MNRRLTLGLALLAAFTLQVCGYAPKPGLDTSSFFGWDALALQRGAVVGRAAAELNPVVGFYNPAYQAATGKDAIYHHQLSTGEQVWSGVSAGLEVAGKAVKVAAGVGAAVATAKAVEGAGDLNRAKRLAEATARGRAAEARVLKEMGLVKNTEKVFGKEGVSIPDLQTTKVIGEIKDAKRLTDSRQLRIQKEAPERSGKVHQIYTGVNTAVSEKAAEGSKIIKRPDLGPK